MAAAKKNGLRVLTSLSEFKELGEDSSALGTIGLFHRDHMSYEIDRMGIRDEALQEPTLAEMWVTTPFLCCSWTYLTDRAGR